MCPSLTTNAALVEQVSLTEITPHHFDLTFALNARAPLFLVQKMLPMMGGGGSIILVASAMHYMGLANHSTYAATKAALRSYARTWAAEFKDNGIRTNTLSPGVVDTPMLDSKQPRPRGPPRSVRATPPTLQC
jgi:NAD(P)-dependent dehydrogenase (short-subunit alcohol dehydrogenase family)